jgi:hypothetical protein
MANNVFANGREIACKAGSGKSICAFPDVCFTPPTAPPTPPGVPIPYPNTAMAGDTTKGSKKVKISGKEVMLKNKSCLKKAMGNEAGCAPKKGIVTSSQHPPGAPSGSKAYFNAWSMDVKVEGENVVRHLDLTTHNHKSFPGNSPTWPYVDTMAVSSPDHPCVEDQIKEMQACKDYQPYGEEDVCAQLGSRKPSQSMDSAEAPAMGTISAIDECLSARRCALQTYSPNGCCHPQTPHHIVEASALAEKSPHGATQANPPNFIAGINNYDLNKAPCVCAEGTSQNVGTHGQFHTFQKDGVNRAITAGSIVKEDIPLASGGTVNEYATTYGDAKKNGLEAFEKTFPESDCDPKCLENQLDAYHNQCDMDDSTKIKAVREGQDDVAAAAETQVDRSHTVYLARKGSTSSR